MKYVYVDIFFDTESKWVACDDHGIRPLTDEELIRFKQPFYDNYTKELDLILPDSPMTPAQEVLLKQWMDNSGAQGELALGFRPFFYTKEEMSYEG